MTHSNQLWEMDVKYGYIAGEDRFFFVMAVLDVFDRSVVAYHIGTTCTSRDAVAALKQALRRRGLQEAVDKPVIRTDNGPQFVSRTFAESCDTLGMEHERIPPRTPNKNAHMEAFYRILEEECLSLWVFESYEETYRTVTEFIRFYNEERIHGSLGYQTPATFHKTAQTEENPLLKVRL